MILEDASAMPPAYKAGSLSLEAIRDDCPDDVGSAKRGPLGTSTKRIILRQCAELQIPMEHLGPGRNRSRHASPAWVVNILPLLPSNVDVSDWEVLVMRLPPVNSLANMRGVLSISIVAASNPTRISTVFANCRKLTITPITPIDRHGSVVYQRPHKYTHPA